MRHLRLLLLTAMILLASCASFAQRDNPAMRQFMQASPQVGEQAVDFDLKTVGDEAVSLSDLWAEKPVVLEFGCITCPVYRRKIQRMQKLYQDYSEDLHFVVLYIVEAHPDDTPSPYSGKVWLTDKNEREGLLRHQPTTYDERVALARETTTDFGEGRMLLVDGMDNGIWEAYGKRPNSLFLIDTDGVVQLKQFWADAAQLQQTLPGMGIEPAAGGDAPPAQQAGPYLQGDVWVWQNIEYGNADGGALLLDAYLPADNESHPALVNIHGGGWRNGSKDGFRREGIRYAADGIAAFSIGYRLSGVAPYPAAVDDCWAAVRWIREHAAELDVDASRMAVQGGSAGGHLALMMAFMEPDEGEALDNYFVCVATMNPPTDFTADDEMRSERALLAFMDTTREEHPERFAEASPVTHLSPDDPPVFFIHGTDDRTVPYNQALILKAALEEAGVEHEFVTIEGGGHGLRGGDRQEIEAGMNRWREFLLEHLGAD